MKVPYLRHRGSEVWGDASLAAPWLTSCSVNLFDAYKVMDFLTAYNSDSDCSEYDVIGDTDDINNHHVCCASSETKSECSNSPFLLSFDFMNKAKESQTIVEQSMINKDSLSGARKSSIFKPVCDDPCLESERLGDGEDNITFSSAVGKNSRAEIRLQNEPSINSCQDYSSGRELTSQSKNSNDALVADYFNLVADENELENANDSNQCDGKFFSFGARASNKMASVDFWANELTPVCDWNQPEKIWGVPSESGNETNTQTLGGHLSVPGNENTHVLLKKRKLADNIEKNDNFESDSLKIPCFTLHHKIAPHLNDARMNKIISRCPKKIGIVLPGLSGTVNRINWCVAEYGHLLLSAAMDSTVRIWNAVSTSSNPCVRTLRCHNKAVKDAIWMERGKHIVSCGFDKTARLCDVEQGKEVSVFPHHDYVNCVKSYPLDSNLFVTGLLDRLIGWDVRSPPKPIRYFKYKDKYGQVQDVCFLSNGTHFLSCADLVNRDSADRNIIVWDFGSGSVLSNQIFHERYTCTRLRVNSTREVFLAQTHGNYIAEFSASSPYRMNKCKRFEDHKVAGYGVGFDVSQDGTLIASGSADGLLYIYDHMSARTLRRLSTSQANDVLLDVAWHPVLFSTVAASTWSGAIIVWH